MKPSQVYSNKKFKRVKFNEEFNLIIGKVTKPKDKEIDSHNLGKTTLIYVIDFLLLRGFDNAFFLSKYKIKFFEYSFFLEILLNDGKYLTIRRSIDYPTKIDFKIHDQKFQDFTKEDNWDHQEVPIDKAKDILNNYLEFDVLPEVNYRKTVSYFLRTQDDYLDVFQLNKYKSSKDIDWKPLLLDLLGFNGELLKSKYELETQINLLNAEIKILETRSSMNEEKLDKIKGFIEVKEEEKKSLQIELDKFNFYTNDRRIDRDLVDSVEADISKLNSELYALEFEEDKINSALNDRMEFSLSEIEKLFIEIKTQFPEDLKKNYENLVEFNKQLSEERSKHLKERLTSLKTQKEEIKKELIDLNNQRSDLLSILQSTDTFEKYKKCQNEIVGIDNQIMTLQQQLSSVGEIGNISSKVTELNNQISKLKDALKENVLKEQNDIYSNIRKTFNLILKEIINLQAIPSISFNKTGNIEFHADIQEEKNNDITAMGRGTTYRKLLCVAFDLSILITYSKNSFFKFVYHDGVLEGLDDRKKIKFIECVKRICQENGLQYVLTSIEHDLPRNSEGNTMQFSGKEIALILSDAGDDGRLFEQSF